MSFSFHSASPTEFCSGRCAFLCAYPLFSIKEFIRDPVAAGVGLEPTSRISGHRFSGPTGYHYLTLPCDEEGGSRTLKPHLQGLGGLAIRCLTIGLTSPY